MPNSPTSQPNEEDLVRFYAEKEDPNLHYTNHMDEEGEAFDDTPPGHGLCGLHLADQEVWPLFRYRYMLREYFAEFFGTMLLLTFGNGVVATTTVNSTEANAGYQSNASYLAITFGWGFGLCMALYISMGVSGGHLNPAVTLANCIFGAFPWRKAPGFILAQLLGAMTGAANVYGLFKPRLVLSPEDIASGATMTTKYGGIFCTYPAVPNGYAVWSEILNTMLLMMCILGINDDRMTPAINFKPVAVGLLVFVLGICTGVNSGYAMNPARDLGPRMVTAMLWGSEPFTLNDYYFWIPMFIPIVGATAGMFFYTVFIVPAC